MKNDSATVAVADAGEEPPKRKRGRPKGNRREAIMREAARLFAERGYHASIDEIGEAAGVTGPTVYAHFRGKDELLIAIIESWVERAEAAIREVNAVEGGPEAQAEALVRSQVRLSIEHGGLFAIYQRELPTLGESGAAMLRRDRKIRDDWIAVLSPLRPDLAQDDIRVLVNGVKDLILRITSSKTRRAPRELEDLIVGFVLAGFRGCRRLD